jgi:hypothetical protein
MAMIQVMLPQLNDSDLLGLVDEDNCSEGSIIEIVVILASIELHPDCPIV